MKTAREQMLLASKAKSLRMRRSTKYIEIELDFYDDLLEAAIMIEQQIHKKTRIGSMKNNNIDILLNSIIMAKELRVRQRMAKKLRKHIYDLEVRAGDHKMPKNGRRGKRRTT